MSVALATVVGGLFAVGTFLLLRRNLVRVVWGIAVITQAANVYLIAMGGVQAATRPGPGPRGPQERGYPRRPTRSSKRSC